MDRYLCPPWYGCRCSPGKPVSESTMLRHMRAANEVRRSLGRGIFRRGPKVLSETVGIYDFGCEDTLEDHPTDVEDYDEPPLQRRRTIRRVRTPSMAQTNEGYGHAAVETATVAPVVNGADPSEDYARDSDIVLHDHESEPDGAQAQNEVEHGESDVSPLESHANDADQFFDIEDGGSRIPGFTYWLQENQCWVDLYYKHGLKNATMDDILKLIEAPCRSWKTVISNITSSTTIIPETYAVCPGHMCFATLAGTAEVTSCEVCGKQKPENADIRPEASVAYLPMVPRFREMISDNDLSKQLYSYRQNRTPSADEMLYDYFDSQSYKSLCDIYGGEEAMKHDIFIAASTDGFQAFVNNSSDVWPVLAVIFNLSPDIRFMSKNVLPLMFIPNDVQPKNIQSYLVPFVNELLGTLEGDGVSAILPNGQLVRFRIHLIWFTADLAGLVKIAGITGHVGRFPCRFCLLQGFYSPAHKHYYYPTWLRSEGEGGRRTVFYDPSNIQPRTLDSVQQAFARLQGARTTTERKRIATETGVKEKSVLLALPNMIPFRCFPPDIMHLFYNVQLELFHHHLSGENEGYVVQPTELEILDHELVSFADGISGQTAVKPRPLSGYKSWKAAEHKLFTLSYYLVIFDGYLTKEYLDGISLFVRLADLCFRSSLSRAEAVEAKRLSVGFVMHYENFYGKHDRERVNYCKYVIHLLLHLGDAMLECGPLISASQYWVEKYIGWIGNRVNARTLPAKAMMRSTWFGEAKRLFFRQPFHENDSDYQNLIQGGGYKFLGPTHRTSFHDLQDDVNVPDLIAAYLVRKYDGLHPSEARDIAKSLEDLTLWSRLQFVCGSDSQTLYSEKVVHHSYARNRERVRSSCNIAVEMDATDDSADIYYGKVVRLLEIDITGSESQHPENSGYEGKYSLAMIKWVNGMSVGQQGQVFKVGSANSVFGRTTVEDVSIIQRLIGVVEHSVPVAGAAGRNVRRRRQTYFLDDFQRIDHLLSRTKSSHDGVKRILRGLR